MNIQINKEEYADLVDLLHIAHWVLSAHKTQKDPHIEKYEELIQKFFSLARDMGRDDLIQYNGRMGKFIPSIKFEETSQAWEFIDDFTNDTFWDELSNRLTQRDLERQEGGQENVNRLSMEERFKLEGSILERYSREFSEHGIERLEIVEQFGTAPWGSPKTSD